MSDDTNIIDFQFFKNARTLSRQTNAVITEEICVQEIDRLHRKLLNSFVQAYRAGNKREDFEPLCRQVNGEIADALRSSIDLYQRTLQY
jgi:hypothetical protein